MAEYNRSSDPTAWAYAWAKVGVPVFPAKSGGKAPATKHGFYDATVAALQIEAWCRDDGVREWNAAGGWGLVWLDLDTDPAKRAAQGKSAAQWGQVSPDDVRSGAPVGVDPYTGAGHYVFLAPPEWRERPPWIEAEHRYDLSGVAVTVGASLAGSNCVDWRHWGGYVKLKGPPPATPIPPLPDRLRRQLERARGLGAREQGYQKSADRIRSVEDALVHIRDTAHDGRHPALGRAVMPLVRFGLAGREFDPAHPTVQAVQETFRPLRGAGADQEVVRDFRSAFAKVAGDFRTPGQPEQGQPADPDLPHDPDDPIGEIVSRWRAETTPKDGEPVPLAREDSASRTALRRIRKLIQRPGAEHTAIMRGLAKAVGAEERSSLLDGAAADGFVEGLNLTDTTELPWLVPGLIPEYRLGLMSGEGGLGKTTLAAQLAYGAASGQPWLHGFAGTLPEKLLTAGPLDQRTVLYVSWEDSRISMAHKLRAAALEHGDAPADAQAKLHGYFHFVNARAAGALWAPPLEESSGHTSNLSTMTAAGRHIQQQAEEVGAHLLILDPLAAVYSANENERGLVRAFLSAWDEWAERTSTTTIIISHPSGKQAVAGSTDWKNGLRCVLSLEVRETGTGEETTIQSGANKGETRKAPAPGVCLSAIKLNDAPLPRPQWLCRSQSLAWNACLGKDAAQWLAVHHRELGDFGSKGGR